MTAADMARLDVPAEQVAAEAIARDAMARTHSPSDRIAYALDARLVTHPELIPSESGDPVWDAWLTARAAEMAAAWTAAHTKTTTQPGRAS